MEVDLVRINDFFGPARQKENISFRLMYGN